MTATAIAVIAFLIAVRIAQGVVRRRAAHDHLADEQDRREHNAWVKAMRS